MGGVSSIQICFGFLEFFLTLQSPLQTITSDYARPSFPRFRPPTWSPFPKPSHTWANIRRPLLANTSLSRTHPPFLRAVTTRLACTRRAARNCVAPLLALGLPHPPLSQTHPYSGFEACFYVLCISVLQMRYYYFSFVH